MRLDVAAILAATGARAVAVRRGERLPAGSAASPTPLDVVDLQERFSGVSIDSRQVQERSLFVALPGERTDGHAHVAAALQSGATGALVSRLPDAEVEAGNEGRYLFLVDDPLKALQELASAWRLGHDALVIGITGSIGKTTTKEILASVLAGRGPVLKSAANLNTEIGLPLTLMGLGPEHQVAVLEMGMYARGDIALLTSIARPDVGVVTNVAPIHLERVGSIGGIARAKSELIAGLAPTGLAILNGDDEWTRAMSVTSGLADIRLVGRREDCDFRAADVESHGLDGFSFVVVAEGSRMAFRTPIPGTHTVHALLSAIAVGRHLGMSWPELQEAVARTGLDERQRIVRDGRSLIIDDSYNAAPMSVSAALELLRQAPGTKVAVLGDMLELGPLEESAHREVGERAASVADWLVTRGPRSRWIAEEATRSGMPAERVRQVSENREAVQAVREIMSANSESSPLAILVKGSRGMHMEDVVAELTGAVRP